MFLREATSRRVVKHLDHVEDLVILRQYAGAKEALAFLRGIIAKLSGKSDGPVNLQMKMDGAPAIVCGRDPADGRFFLGMKGALSATPKIAKSPAEVATLTDTPDVRAVLTAVFDSLKDMAWAEVVQGDVLWTPDLKREKTIDEVACWTFQPNTIVYAVPKDSSLGRRIGKADLGLALHTTYRGASLATMTATLGVAVDRLRAPDRVCLLSTDYRDLAGTVTFTKAESDVMRTALRHLQQQTDDLKRNPFLTFLGEWPLLRSEFMVFQNALVRKGQSITLTPDTFGRQFVLFLSTRQHALKPKKAKSKVMVPELPPAPPPDADADLQYEYRRLVSAHQEILMEAQREGSAHHETLANAYTIMAKAVARAYPGLVMVLRWQRDLVRLKGQIIAKLNVPTELSSYYETERGLIAGAPEGYVASDRSGDIVKLVDRSVFSKHNFNHGKFS